MKKKKLSKQKLNRIRNLRKKQTPQETIIWARLRNRKFKDLKFRRQYSIGRYVVDFICFDKKLIIEIDGWQHKEDKNYDSSRTKTLEKLGFKVVRFWNNDINNNLDGVFLKIEDELES